MYVRGFFGILDENEYSLFPTEVSMPVPTAKIFTLAKPFERYTVRVRIFGSREEGEFMSFACESVVEALLSIEQTRIDEGWDKVKILTNAGIDSK